ncbi:hypothetical protein CAOG_09224 [Capsaspora owczarzaki ATCC 30864]|uniref:hypothetical protein n=1 Tax=Capsaspora owczarzaki (strain ATCC 30864) TaxID=595528 RepID=UPI0003526C5F|nr:hypothetical protein CAOG_09224 [Capsaspora owczarzaki ATCC 30864]|eukprot:XP_011270940.1 hypothetical protein CAOG_09224 [Capsaspora owczarzaki ATCC 30864]
MTHNPRSRCSSDVRYTVNGISAIALIDTGASRSVSSSTFAEKHKLPLGPPEAIPCLYSVNNAPVPIKGLTTPLRIVVSNLSVDHPLLILPNASHDIIIGCDLLKAHRASIDVATDKAHFHGLPPVSSNPSVDEVLASASATAPELPVPAPKVQLPSEYQDFSDLFDKKSAETLPPHRPGFDLEIKLKDESSLRAAPLYKMSPEELSTLEVEIKELLRKGFIRESKSPISSPVLFTLKADGSRRMVVDGRQVNAVTIPNSYPLPLISELIDQLGPSRSRPSCSKIFTKVDLRSAYHLLRVKEGDEYKTAFRCQLGLFEFLVAPFGHINSGACFQRFIASLLQSMVMLKSPAMINGRAGSSGLGWMTSLMAVSSASRNWIFLWVPLAGA